MRTIVATVAVLVATAPACGQGTSLQVHRGVSAGAYHTCAVSSAGAVSCWGWNLEGALGNGTTRDSLKPVPVSGLTGGVATVSSNYSHSCALLVTGNVKCWGRNSDGQLGDGSKTMRTKPVSVKGLPAGIVAAATGKDHSCATTSSSVYCWGRFSKDSRSLVPVKIAGLSDIAAIAVAKGFACVVTGTGRVKCWGKNDQGQLGDGTGVESLLAPVDVAGLSGVTSISASGDYACAVTASSEMRCWGENDHGQLGDGTRLDRFAPVTVVDPGTDLVSVVAGANNTCSLSTTSGVRCWGRNDHGQLGDGSFVESHLPVTVQSLGAGVEAISAGASGHFVCALTTAGAVKCWGRNQYGQLGDGTTTDRPLPRKALVTLRRRTSAPSPSRRLRRRVRQSRRDPDAGTRPDRVRLGPAARARSRS